MSSCIYQNFHFSALNLDVLYSLLFVPFCILILMMIKTTIKLKTTKDKQDKIKDNQKLCNLLMLDH